MDTYDRPKIKHSRAPSLAAVMGFSEDELELNRDGYLSDPQRKSLRGAAETRMLVVLVTVLAMFVATMIVMFDGVGDRMLLSDRVGLLTPFLIGGGLTSLVLKADMSNFRQDSHSGIAEAVQGHVELDIASGKNSVTYALNIGHLHFGIDKEVFLAFKNDEPYAVYFAPHTQKLLSAEWLREPDREA